CSADVEAKLFDNGSYSGSGDNLTFSVEPAGPYSVGTTEVVFTVTDSRGQSASCQTSITVKDESAPVFAALADVVVPVEEGSCFANPELPLPEVTDNCEISSLVHDHSGVAFGVGETIITWTATDIHGNASSATQKVRVINEVPVIASVEIAPSRVPVNVPAALRAHFADENISKAMLDWGDGSSPHVIPAPVESLDRSYAYKSAGIYTVTLTL